jgi:hypothetical protein
MRMETAKPHISGMLPMSGVRAILAAFIQHRKANRCNGNSVIGSGSCFSGMKCHSARTITLPHCGIATGIYCGVSATLETGQLELTYRRLRCPARIGAVWFGGISKDVTERRTIVPELHLSRGALLLALACCSPAFANDPPAQTPPAQVDTATAPASPAPVPAPGPTPASSAGKQPASGQPAAASETSTPANKPQQAANTPHAGDEEIVCKKIQMTGTRLRKGKVCKSQKEWRELANSARDVMKRNDRKRSTQPGGETLIGGG